MKYSSKKVRKIKPILGSIEGAECRVRFYTFYGRKYVLVHDLMRALKLGPSPYHYVSTAKKMTNANPVVVMRDDKTFGTTKFVSLPVSDVKAWINGLPNRGIDKDSNAELINQLADGGLMALVSGPKSTIKTKRKKRKVSKPVVINKIVDAVPTPEGIDTEVVSRSELVVVESADVMSKIQSYASLSNYKLATHNATNLVELFNGLGEDKQVTDYLNRSDVGALYFLEQSLEKQALVCLAAGMSMDDVVLNCTTVMSKLAKVYASVSGYRKQA